MMVLTDQRSLLGRLLDPDVSPTPAPKCKKRNHIREREFEASPRSIGSSAQIMGDGSLSDDSVTPEVVSRMQKLFDKDKRICRYGKLKHKQGELCHYFDSVWVLTGSVQDERLICGRVRKAKFVPLRFCPGTEDKENSNIFCLLWKKGGFHAGLSWVMM
jgi:hypothetical protein